MTVHKFDESSPRWRPRPIAKPSLVVDEAVADRGGGVVDVRTNHHLPSIREMELFVHAVQTGSFSAAGRRVGLSPASVSRYINAVEDRLGVRLLNRSSRKLSLSDSGEIFYRHANELLAQMRSLQSELAARQEEPAGRLRVRAMMMVGTAFVAQAISEFSQAYPKIEIDLTISNDATDIIEDNIDIDIRSGFLAESSMIARKLKRSERYLCAAPRYLASAPRILSPACLRRHNCLAYRNNHEAVTWTFRDRAGLLAEVPVAGSLVSNSGDVLLTLARNGIGIALLPDWSIEEDLRTGALVRVLPEHQVSFAGFENDVFAVYSSTRHLPTRTRAFLDFLIAFFQRS